MNNVIELDSPQVTFLRSLMSLYGEHWKEEGALALDLNHRTIRRMADGKVPIPAGIWKEMDRLLLEEANRLLQLAASTPKVSE